METSNIDNKLLAMRSVYDKNSALSIAERKTYLKKLYKNILDMQPEIYAALKADLNLWTALCPIRSRPPRKSALKSAILLTI